MTIEAESDVLNEAPMEPFSDVIYEFGDKANKGRPPPKIQGTQHKWREEKQKPRLIIRKPYEGNTKYPTKPAPNTGG